MGKIWQILIKNKKNTKNNLLRAIESISTLSITPALHDEMTKLDEIHDYLQGLLDHYY